MAMEIPSIGTCSIPFTGAAKHFDPFVPQSARPPVLQNRGKLGENVRNYAKNMETLQFHLNLAVKNSNSGHLLWLAIQPS